MLLEHYPEIRNLHIASVLLSGGLFLVRGLLVQLGGKRLAMAAPVRFLSYGIDTILLASALLLVVILPWALFHNGWLAVKVALVVIYVVLGTLALKRGRTAGSRRTCYILALLTFFAIIGIAKAHHPMGWLYLWFA